jgi:hypothetical protein
MASDVFGLVVGNVGLASSREMMSLLRDELRKAGKKSYTISVGRLNPAKLANFAEVECFVLVGCSEGGVVDSKVGDSESGALLSVLLWPVLLTLVMAMISREQEVAFLAEAVGPS